jgi:hypothetical protein
MWLDGNGRAVIGPSPNYAVAEMFRTPMHRQEPNGRLIKHAPEMVEALDLLEDAASCLAATFERIPENYPERSAIHTHEGHTEAYLLDQIKAARALLSRIRGDAP